MNEYPAWVQPATRKYCARSGRHGHPERPVLPGTDLCGPCHASFPRMLRNIVEDWSALLGSVARRPGRVYSDAPAGGGEHSDAGTYWNPAATIAINDVVDWHTFVLGTIRRERSDVPLHGLGFIDDTDVRAGLAVAARWHTRWLTHYPGLGPSLVDDARRLSNQVRMAMESVVVQRVYLDGHHCSEVVRETEYGPIVCAGQLVAVLQPDGSDRPSKILCTTNPRHTIPVEEWIHLAH
jgi:hypothetical protein